MLTFARAGLSSDMEDDDAWREVALRAGILPEDMQGVFLLIARAAKENLPCPSDIEIARTYGTHSIRRARRAPVGPPEVIRRITIGFDRRGDRSMGPADTTYEDIDCR
jgi:hypothetical protein